MVAREAYLPLDDTSLGAKRAALCETDDAAVTAVGLYAVLDSKQLAEKILCHCVPEMSNRRGGLAKAG